VRLRPRWKDQHRAKPLLAEFGRDVIAVARKGEASISQIARDFGISKSCLQRWLKIADRDDGLAQAWPRPRPATAAAARSPTPQSCVSCVGGTSCWSRRTRSCAGRRPTSPATCPKMIYPLVRELAAAEKIPVAVTCPVLGNS
jgi:transposase-like protein